MVRPPLTASQHAALGHVTGVVGRQRAAARARIDEALYRAGCAVDAYHLKQLWHVLVHYGASGGR